MNKNLDLFLTFMKIGAFTFGGGYAMIPLIQKEVCENKKWLNEKVISDIVARTVFFPSSISLSAFSSANFWVFLGLFAVTAVLAFKKVHPIKIILLPAVVGICTGYALEL